MRLIDADKLKVAHGVFCPRVEGSREIYALPADAVFADEIESAPTVDAVPVIRCKDCKYYRDGDCWHERENDRWIYYQSIIEEPNPDDYCSRAERKEE